MKYPAGCSLLILALLTATAHAEEKAVDISRVLPAGQLPQDARLGKQRSLRDKYHPWTPPATKELWEFEASEIRKRVLVSTGLWPMPPRPEIKAVIHGKIDRGDYTVEKVYFTSVPGHYVSGNLYRPKNLKGKTAAVLSPHGHWQDARFYDAGEGKAKALIAGGGETFLAAARHHVQARMVGLARMGCVVFHYDMVGYSDSKQLGHSAGLTGLDSLLRLQNSMGLQTYNSLCALDFLTSLPDVDRSRVGVTGASGGGTQTFILSAIDPRPAAAFPAVMASTAMQGGCTCENASYLRIGINNIAITALFAPKPLAMTGADDWTKEIETKGLPELKQVYALYGKSQNVTANAFPQFKHNYNQVARELMYAWFNEHLKVGYEGDYKELDFNPVSRDQLTVWDAGHSQPASEGAAESLRRVITEYQDEAFAALLPETKEGVERYYQVVRTAANVMLDTGVPEADELERQDLGTDAEVGYNIYKLLVGRKGAKEQIPLIALVSPEFDGEAVLWIHPQGKAGLFDDQGKPQPAVQDLMDAGFGVVGTDLFLTGEFVAVGEKPKYPQVDKNYGGYTFGYNRPVLSNRVRDILTAIGTLVEDDNINTVHLIGTGEAGPWALLARGLAGGLVKKTVIDAGGFGFSKIKSFDDPMLLPGALKYGGLGGLAALAAPDKLTIAGTKDVPRSELRALTTVYKASEGKLSLEDGPLTMKQAAAKMIE